MGPAIYLKLMRDRLFCLVEPGNAQTNLRGDTYC